MGKKAKKKRAAAIKFRLSSVGTWVRAKDAPVWTLQSDSRYNVYRGQTPETKAQWFLAINRSMSIFEMYREQKPVTPVFLGAVDTIEEALDLADVEITRQRFEAQQRADAQ